MRFSPLRCYPWALPKTDPASSFSFSTDFLPIRFDLAAGGCDIGALSRRLGELTDRNRNGSCCFADLALVATLDGSFEGPLGNVVLMLRCD